MAKIFTKKFALILLTVVVAASGVIWAVVANIQSKFNSEITTVPAGNFVSGNGSASVLVDNYLYFIGDSVATTEIKYGDNEYYAHGKMHDAGIFRVKIEDSQPVLTYEYDNNSVNDAGEKITLQPGDDGYNSVVVGVNDWDNIGEKGNGIEAVVPKIAGHDQAAMWVFGQTLIYVSPHNRYDNRGNLLSNYLDFFRVDLNGEHHDLIYTTESADLTTDNFTVWADSVSDIYLLVHETENNAINKINIKDKKVTTLAEDVVDVTFPKNTHYSQNTNETLDKVYGGVMSYVYYTKAREESDNNLGNILYRCPIKAGEAEKIASEGSATEGTTFKPLAVTPLANGNAQFVFSAQPVNGDDEASKDLYLITNENMNQYNFEDSVKITWGTKVAEEVKIYANGFCTINNQLRYYEINGADMIFRESLLTATVDKVLAVYGNTIYVQSGNTVWKAGLNQTANSISVVPASEDSSDEDTETTTEASLTLPLAILYQPHGATGDPMIFAQDANHIRLYTSNGKVNYLKFK